MKSVDVICNAKSLVFDLKEQQASHTRFSHWPVWQKTHITKKPSTICRVECTCL